MGAIKPTLGIVGRHEAKPFLVIFHCAITAFIIVQFEGLVARRSFSRRRTHGCRRTGMRGYCWPACPRKPCRAVPTRTVYCPLSFFRPYVEYPLTFHHHFQRVRRPPPPAPKGVRQSRVVTCTAYMSTLRQAVYCQGCTRSNRMILFLLLGENTGYERAPRLGLVMAVIAKRIILGRV
jgi:hypothetical protein